MPALSTFRTRTSPVGHLRTQWTSSKTPPDASTTDPAPILAAPTATTTLSADAQHPRAPPRSVTIISIIPATTFTATTTGAPTPTAEQLSRRPANYHTHLQ
nr:unnamed protein product [Spirometra erinaceieuropaei]